MKILLLNPVEMSAEIMEDLEKLGLIIRLCPNRDDTPFAKQGEAFGKTLYEPIEGYGPHKIITVIVNRETFSGFGTHPDNEEFILIGNDNTQPLYLAIAYLTRENLDKKIATKTLEASDFIALHVRYNDPAVSFFVMKAGVPHGEAIIDLGRKPASFFVTESRDLPLDLTDFCDYLLQIKNGN